MRARVRGGCADSRRRARELELEKTMDPKPITAKEAFEASRKKQEAQAEELRGWALLKVRQPPNEPNLARVSRTFRRVCRAASVARADRTP